MIKSMTGYGAAEKNGIKVEVRSLNHKFIEIYAKMPSQLNAYDLEIRKLVKTRFQRGKFDLSVAFTSGRAPQVRVNKELARNIHSAFSELKNEMSIPGEINIDFFTNFRELLSSEDQSVDETDLFGALEEALDSLAAMRDKEGGSLYAELSSLLDEVEKMRSSVSEFAAEMVKECCEKLKNRIAELAPQVEESRLAQEAAVIAQKADITEELARLGSHIGQFRGLLGSEEPVGRRLDFILQEMNREANTISSKADDLRIINIAIGMKAAIEKIREQVQNIQ
ncbi:MAG: YicC family protein [Nitrospiraceae bacterium]|nr:YicC family protein [Nitrospiraceae bacterium]